MILMHSAHGLQYYRAATNSEYHAINRVNNMFRTIDEAEIPLPKGLASSNEHSWSAVHLGLHLPWLYVTCHSVLQVPRVQKVLFLSTIDQLEDAIDDVALTITAVYLVSPGNLNGTSHWQMDLLNQIELTTNDREGGQVTTFFSLMDGRVVSYPNAGEKPLGRTEKIYQART
jgi:hypothetical protein